MYGVLLSGGSGERLWPLSNGRRSKQYIKVLPSEQDSSSKVSMVQRIWSQLENAGLASNCIVCASISQVESLQAQLGDIPIAVEPARRNTYPAVVLSSAYISSILHAKDDDIVCVFPVDPYTDDSYFETIKLLERTLVESGADIALMGVVPTYPSAKYGYILPCNLEGKGKDSYFSVKGFSEKPNEALAKQFISEGALWNCGVFCFRLSLLKQKLASDGLLFDYDYLFAHYETLPRISFDYEVLEKQGNMIAVPYHGEWKDLGTWNTLTEQMDAPVLGNVRVLGDCRNTHVINELSTPTVVMGIPDSIVVVTPDGVLVSKKEDSVKIKEALTGFDLFPMYEEKSWGSITTLDKGSDAITQKVLVFPGMQASFPQIDRVSHWIVVKGNGVVTLSNKKERRLSCGVSLHIPSGESFCVKAENTLECIVVTNV